MVDERVWTMESWVGVKSCLSQYSSPPFSFPLFHYWFRVCEKGGQKSNGLGFELGKFILLFFFGQEVSYPFISFQVYTLLSSGYWRFIEKKKGLELSAF